MELMIFALAESVGTYLSARYGAKRSYRFFESDILSVTEKMVHPAKCIAKHFGIGAKTMSVPSYLRFILAFVLLWRIPALALAALLCPARFTTIYAFSAILLCAVALIFFFVFDLPVEIRLNRKKKARHTTPISKQDRGESIFQIMRQSKENAWVFSMTQEIGRYQTTQKNESYLTPRDLGYVEREVFPKYKKYIHSRVIEEDGKRWLLVHAKKSKRCVLRMEIRFHRRF